MELGSSGNRGSRGSRDSQQQCFGVQALCWWNEGLGTEVMSLARDIRHVPPAQPAWGHLQPQCEQGPSTHPSHGHPTGVVGLSPKAGGMESTDPQSWSS